MDWLDIILVKSLLLISLNCALIYSETTTISALENNATGITLFVGKTISRDEWLAKEYFGYLCGESNKHLLFMLY